MIINEEFINTLTINENEIVTSVSDSLNIPQKKVLATVSLIREDSSVPFISRYRKEATGGLDEVQVRDIFHKLEYFDKFFQRRIEVIKNIFEKDKLTEDLYKNLMNTLNLKELEVLYAPYKSKKKTRAMIAEEKGLKNLSGLLYTGTDEQVLAGSHKYINKEKGVETVEDAIQGAQDIIAEVIAHNLETRIILQRLIFNEESMSVSGKGEEDKSVYKLYYSFLQKLKLLKPHQILAIIRGEKEKELSVKIDLDIDKYQSRVLQKFRVRNQYFKIAVFDGVKRLLLPSIVREIRSVLHENAQTHGISVFAENLKNLLLQPPIQKSRVLGIDPGIRSGCKAVTLDENGKYLDNFIFYTNKQSDSEKKLIDAIKKYDISLIAIGNGTGSIPVQKIVSGILSKLEKDVNFTIVSEDGASVYSASDIAREEFPELDLTIRGAISIGRRIQDPLAELVKIEPKAIGVGLYQHDLNQKSLSESLSEVVESVVNNVGVNLNSASVSLLKHVSGISPGQAKKMIKYREETGTIKSRKEIAKIPGIGPKTLEQASGFLKVPESVNPLDNTWVHPENYKVAALLYEKEKSKQALSDFDIDEIVKEYDYSRSLINEILDELRKPNRDPRDECPKPILQKGVLEFSDLSIGMKIKGRVKNVVDFGAFIDLGIKETGLVHISQLSDTFVKNPHDFIKVGDVREFDIIEIDKNRKRISLSLKKK